MLYIVLALMLLSPAKAEKIYSVGVVPQFETRRIVEIWQPILDHINQKSGVTLVLKTSSSIPEFEKQFNTGVFDFAYMNAYHTIVANKNQGYTPLLRDNDHELNAIIVVKKDSNFKTVKDLDGKIVAFPAPNALATLLPLIEFATIFNIEIKPIYVKSHSSVYLNVILGKASAGGGVQKTLTQQSNVIRNQLHILHKTISVPAHPITAHPRVDKAIQEKIIAAFLDMAVTESGKAMLKNIPIKRLGNADMSDYAPLKKMGLDNFTVEN